MEWNTIKGWLQKAATAIALVLAAMEAYEALEEDE